MARKITATELAKNLSEILSRAQYRGESFVIERNGETVATLNPPETPIGIPFRELAERVCELPQPDETFADDVEAVHAAQGELEPPPWPA